MHVGGLCGVVVVGAGVSAHGKLCVSCGAQLEARDAEGGGSRVESGWWFLVGGDGNPEWREGYEMGARSSLKFLRFAGQKGCGAKRIVSLRG